MHVKKAAFVFTLSLLAASCASQRGAQPAADSPTTATPSGGAANKGATPGARLVKSRNGAFDGEVVGDIIPGSRFSKLQIGMTMREVSATIGAADDSLRHETGKRWIPFYFGNDSQRIQTYYKGEGCLTFTGGNVFGGGDNELIAITATKNPSCLDG